MVYIKKVDIRGFKSFPNRTVSIAFCPNLNVITGMNGSGKSNILDAIRFTLGENSPKELRQPKMSKLIFDKERVSSARVTLVLDNSDKAIPVDSDTVYITREIKENGESTFYLNHKKVLRSTIIEILEAARISYNGLNIVPQGTITRIAEFNPNERRHILESLIGLKSFDEKKAQAMEKLREADTQLAIAFAKLDEKRKLIEKLEEERNELIRYEILESKVKSYRASVLHHEISTLELKRNGLRERLREIEGELIEKEREIEDVQRKLKEIEKERSDFYSANVDSIMSELTKINNQLQKVRIRKAEVEERRNALLSDKRKIEESRPELERMLKEGLEELKRKREELEELKKRYDDLESKHKEISKLVEEKRKELKRKELSVERWRGSLLKVQARIRKVREKKNEVERMLAEQKERKEELFEALEDLKSRYREAEESVRRLEEKIENLREIYRIEERGLTDIKGRLERLENIRAKLIREMGKANDVLLRSLKELTKVEAKREVYEKFLRDIAIVEKVDEYLSTGAFEGYIGKLNDIVKAGERFREAIEAVLFSTSNIIVVKDEDARRRLIDIVKKIGGGRVRILPLTFRIVKRSLSGPGVIGPISNFLVYHERYKHFVEGLFGNVYLVESEEAAKFVISKGYKAVTIDGVLFDERGVVEAGLIPKLEPKKLELDYRRARALKGALMALDKTLARKRGGLERLREEIKKLYSVSLEKKLAAEKKGIQIEALTGMISRYEKLCKKMKAKIDKLERKTSLIEVRVQKLEKYRKNLQEREKKLEERRNKITKSLSKVKVEEVKKALSSLEEEARRLVSDMLMLNLKISDVSKEVTGELEPRVKKLEDTLKAGEERIARINSELESLEEELPKLREEESILLKKRKEEEEKITKLMPTLNQIEEELEREKKKEKKLMDSKWKLEREKMKVLSDLEILKRDIEDKGRRLEELRVDVIPEYHSEIPKILSDLEAELSTLYGSVNQLAKQNYKEAYTSYKLASVRRGELEKDRNAIVRFIEEVEAEKKRTFMAAFEKIDKEIRSIFSKITGGEAWLELENPEDPFSGGVFLMVKFPGKSGREASSVSGGEKTVSAVSFLLALQAAYPSPFYLLDEIDQSLDPIYAEKLGELLRDWSEKIQIITISLRDLLVSKAHNLIGVYAREGVSNVVKYRLEGIKA